ncbi:putative extensin [Iris pallida]|uniref:Extensin n=1 Tax=Iris pallida TaxID=29817 RepID=A0AAX6F557_IRIPA|nr:putative extensin [Iris pallida]
MSHSHHHQYHHHHHLHIISSPPPPPCTHSPTTSLPRPSPWPARRRPPWSAGHHRTTLPLISFFPPIHPSVQPPATTTTSQPPHPPPPPPLEPWPPPHAAAPCAAPHVAALLRMQQQLRQQQDFARARVQAATAGASAAVVGQADPHVSGRTPGVGPMAANILRDAPSRRFVRFERDPVGAREFGTQNSRPIAATSHPFFRRSDHWIGDFFSPSQSRFAGPTSSASISTTAAPFGVLPIPVRSWTLWLQWDPPILISCSGYRGE